ncbi:Bro-N domain-containing protein [Pectobacterium sp. IFB5596]|uniref:BRO-N domain-containing protein n=1 Tax=Pectobacterium sp. IFB5596 TaxID=1839803 RepID=UPI001F432D89|nr:Bro-N domain-containing protein [Pectobacterium sp. IFB5596]MCE9733825.1 hypothetical protein [Pectobacterium sp. IFB5596]
MHNVAKTELVFHETAFIPTRRNGQIWFTASDLARALQYANVKSITNLYNQNSDEFSAGMSLVIDSVTNGINDSSRKMKIRIFSLRGAHLLAMFARTPVAKEFRRWVLDILDRESKTRAISGKGRLKVSCPCCGKPASVLSTCYLNRHRTEVIAICDKETCPTQAFKSELSFSHYTESRRGEGDIDSFIQSLSHQQKQQLTRLLIRSA